MAKQLQDEMESDQLHPNDASLPLVSDTAGRTASVPAVTFKQRISFIGVLILFVYLYTWLAIILLLVSSAVNLFVGGVFAATSEAMLQWSWGNFSGLLRVMAMAYWPYLKTSWMGSVAIGLVVGPVIGIACLWYRLRLMGFSLLVSQQIFQERLNPLAEKLDTLRVAVISTVIGEALTIAAIPLGIFLRRFWDGDVTDVGEHLVRYVAIVFVGGVVSSGLTLYRKWNTTP